jgi:hypothetical protein
MPGSPNTASSRATHAASRPAIRHAMAEHQPLGQRPVGEQPENQEETRKPGIDQARPMDIKAGRRRDPRLMQIEPALTSQEVAHPDQPHRVVCIRKGVAGHGPELGHELHHHQEPGKTQQDREVRSMH